MSGESNQHFHTEQLPSTEQFPDYSLSLLPEDLSINQTIPSLNLETSIPNIYNDQQFTNVFQSNSSFLNPKVVDPATTLPFLTTSNTFTSYLPETGPTHPNLIFSNNFPANLQTSFYPDTSTAFLSTIPPYLRNWHTVPNPIIDPIYRKDQIKDIFPHDGLKNPSRKSKSTTSEKIWRPDDDSLLLDLVVRMRNDWKKILREFKKRSVNVTVPFLKARYKVIKNNPFELRVRFTHDEDVCIARYIKVFGKKWEKVAEFLPNRTPIMIKNRYYSYIKKRNIMKSLLEEAEQQDSKIDLPDSNFAENSSNLSSLSTQTPRVKNLEDKESDDSLEIFTDYAPEEQLNEKVTPFMDPMSPMLESDFENNSYYRAGNGMNLEEMNRNCLIQGIAIKFDRDEDQKFFVPFAWPLKNFPQEAEKDDNC